jgi:hypothetical protein
MASRRWDLAAPTVATNPRRPSPRLADGNVAFVEDRRATGR